MAELIINAEQMMELLKKHHFRGIKEMIAEAPEIVRCRDCEYYQYGTRFTDIKFCCRLRNGEGEIVKYNRANDDFCSYGVRRNDGKID